MKRAIALGALLAACGGESNALSSSPHSDDAGHASDAAIARDASIETGGGAASTDASVPPPPPSDAGATVDDTLAAKVVGTYALRTIVATVTDVPIIGKSASTSTSYGLSTIARDGAGLKVTQTGCHVDASSGGGVTTTIPDAIPKSVPPTTNVFRVWQEGSDVRFGCNSNAVAIGVHLADADTDALPTDAKDARIWDQDGDGQPGVTVKISGLASGDIYVVQKQKSSYEGTMRADGAMSGLVTDQSAQSVVGASNPVLDTNIASTPDDPSKSTVLLVKVPATYDCAMLMANASSVFP